MQPLNLLLVGCGMMGARHVRGIGELERTWPGTIRLAAVCDRREDLARKVALEAEGLLGARPAVYTDIGSALAAEELHAADVVTEPRSHDSIACGLLDAGLHVLCEKPLALTVARGRGMIDRARDKGLVLATAENNRWDPMNRLCRAALDAGAIGAPNFLMQISFGAADTIIGTAWRHKLAMGGVLLDVAIHNVYIMEYLLGPIEAVSAQAQIVRRHREGREWDGAEVQVDVDAEDCFTAVLEFGDGAHGQWTTHFASAGETMFKRLILGSEGTLNCPPDRSGRPVELQQGSRRVSGDELVAELPGHHLGDICGPLFGDRIGSYTLEGPVTDRRLIAAEMRDFALSVAEDRAPESGGDSGLRSVAAVYAVLESALAGRTVTMEEVLGGHTRAYQDTVEAVG